ncbi:hypothetical protein ISG33_13630 [Glaciecola sp. MH2013]|uniref:hypothetical protein n=1 Tax=Glaciecola sp. MH2013 TaxID=2785524 RepID=UPI0018A0B24D|nr:hypothetical protein [Glaciecola sp. MH2013]MBF7074442.1 hypothetical protein [Glaciecola sp. MH2013]
MASVLLLYYHLVEGGGFIGSEAVYIDPDHFNGVDYIDVSVESSNRNEICEELLRQGAVIYLLCNLNTMIGEFREERPDLNFTKKIVDMLKRKALFTIPELAPLLKLFDMAGPKFDYKKYYELLDIIFLKYVVGKFSELGRE